jgi:hypothetical protein
MRSPIVLAIAVLSACGGDKPIPNPIAPSSAPPEPVVAMVRLLAVSPSASVVLQGRQVQVSATLTLSDGSTEDHTNDAEWSTSDPSVAVVRSKGLIEAVAPGSVAILAAYGDLQGSATLRVDVFVPKLEVAGRSELRSLGETSQLTLTAILADGSRVDRTSAAQWQSFSPNVASVTGAGLVTAVANGQSDIQASYERASIHLMVVVNVPPPSLVIDAPTTNPTGLRVTFAWHMDNAALNRSYRFQVRLDKGVDPCDSGIEESFDAGDRTKLTVTLDDARYRGFLVDFAIRADDGQGFKTCVYGRRFKVP